MSQDFTLWEVVNAKGEVIDLITGPTPEAIFTPKT